MAKDFMAGMKKVSTQLPSSTFSEIEKIKKQIIVVEELRQFITPLTTEEYKTLESNIIQQGCKDPLTIWETTPEIAGIDDSNEKIYVLIDGHNRYKICEQYHIDFKITVFQFENLDKVKDYMIDFQLGRRNLTPEQISYFRGLRYNREKNSKGKYDRETKGGDLSKQLAKEFQVSARTIKNDGRFAEGIAKLSPELQQKVLSGKTSLSRTLVQDLAKKEATKVNDIQSLEEIEEAAHYSTTNTKREEAVQKRKEIAKLVMNLSSKADYSLLVQKVKELKKFL
ncbi:MAG: hypothetical protein R2822_31255 [Spirosomataceae bacterium]